MTSYVEYRQSASSWMEDAACIEVGGEMFVSDEPHYSPEIQLAKQVCNRHCPVVDECLTYSLSFSEVPAGIWGGLTWRERQELKRRGSA